MNFPRHYVAMLARVLRNTGGGGDATRVLTASMQTSGWDDTA
jgi:hypothetical protein